MITKQWKTGTLASAAAALAALSAPAHAGNNFFDLGDLVVSVEGNGVVGATSGTYTDNQASPFTLFQYLPNGTSSASYIDSLVLPQIASNGNYAVSAEYGSSSEGAIQLSGNGQYLTVMGYGVNAATFNANPYAYGTLPALAQSNSLTGQSVAAVPRVVVTVDGNGNVNSSTAIYNVFNGNNPRSVYSATGSTFYISGQGTSGDNTGGVFYTSLGSHSATAITGLDTSSGTASQDTRNVQIVNGQLYVSVDSKGGSGNARSYIGTLGAAGSPPTSLANGGAGPTMLNGFGNTGGTGKEVITAATSNGINKAGQTVNLSPEAFFFANASTLYVADGGSPKNNSASTATGDGGLQKWVNSNADGSGIWTLAYTISAGLNLVSNTSASGTTGLLSLTGKVVNGQVELFTTNYTVGDTDKTYLFGITDTLSATTKAGGEAFSILATAPVDSNFKGVSFAPVSPVPEPATYAMFGTGLLMLWAVRRRQAR